MSRLQPLSHAQMLALDPEFARYYDELSQRGGRTGGPGIAYQRNPETFRINQLLGDSVRTNTLSARERLIAVLVTIRHYGARYAWAVQTRQALASGLSRDAVDAINERRRPEFADTSESMAWEVSDMLAGRRTLDAATYGRALDVLGERRLVDLVTTIGFFSMVGTTLAAFDIDAPDEVEIPLKP